MTDHPWPEDHITPTSASAPAQTPPEISVPKSQTGWVRKIREYCVEHDKHLSVRQTKNLAGKIAKRAARMQYVDPDELIRYVLTYADPTGEEAVRRLAG